MATLRMRLERWFSDVTESYFLRVTMEVAGSTPPDIRNSLKVKRADLDTREPEELIGVCNRVEMERLPPVDGLYHIHFTEVSYSQIQTLPGENLVIDTPNVPPPWVELGILFPVVFNIVNDNKDLMTVELSTPCPCAVPPFKYSLPSLPLDGVDALAVRERTPYPESEYTRTFMHVAPYDDLAGVVNMVETLKTEAQVFVDEWNKYETEYEGIDLEIFE